MLSAAFSLDSLGLLGRDFLKKKTMQKEGGKTIRLLMKPMPNACGETLTGPNLRPPLPGSSGI